MNEWMNEYLKWKESRRLQSPSFHWLLEHFPQQNQQMVFGSHYTVIGHSGLVPSSPSVRIKSILNQLLKLVFVICWVFFTGASFICPSPVFVIWTHPLVWLSLANLPDHNSKEHHFEHVIPIHIRFSSPQAMSNLLSANQEPNASFHSHALPFSNLFL